MVGVLGILLTLLVLKAMVQEMLVPRGTRSWVARALNSAVGAVSGMPLTFLRSYRARDKWIASAAPVSVLLQLVIYFFLIIATMAMVMYGFSDLTPGQAFYQSGSSVTTLGVVEPIDNAGVAACFIAAFLGLVVVAIFIGYLMAIYGAYGARESQMARLALLAGQPPWGPEIIARGHVLGRAPDDVLIYDQWIDWMGEVRLNQSVNPVVARFRSTDPLRHWVISMLAVTDAVSLHITSEQSRPDPHALQMLLESAVAMRLLAAPRQSSEHNLRLQTQMRATLEGGPGRPADAGLSDEDWQAGVRAMQAVGVQLPDDVDAWRDRFLAIRGFYAPDAYRLAQEYYAVPAPWSGPRQPPLPTHWPALAGLQK